MSDRYDASLPSAERKRHGIFYTPAPVVRYLLRATRPAGPVADLSCGDGAFLVEAARAGHPVMGVERDPLALGRAAEALAVFPACRVALHCGDGLQPTLPWTPDVVLGNPPYLEAKKTDRALKARCRALFPAIARGAIDLFVCFVQAGLDALPEGGRLGYIIPNKFLIADYALPLREALLAETTIEELIDVSDPPTFRDAAIYPVLLVLRKAPPPADHRVRTGRVTDLAQLDTGTFPRGEMAQARWRETSRRVFWLPPDCPIGRGLVDRLMGDGAATRLSDLLEIRWTLSFHRGGLRDRFVFPQPTGRCPMRLLGGMRFHGNGDVRRYRTAWSGWWIDYDEERARTERNSLPPRALFTQPKLLIAQNARRIIATLDREGYACKDTFLIGLPKGDASLPCLLGVLNSALMSYLYGVVFNATHVGGAYLHYLGGYLGDLPIRAGAREEIGGLVERLLDPTTADAERRALDRRLDEVIFDLYALSPAERDLVTAAIPYAWGDGDARRGRWHAGEHR